MKRSLENLGEKDFEGLARDILQKQGYFLSQPKKSSFQSPDLWQGYEEGMDHKVICEVYYLSNSGQSSIERFLDKCQSIFNNYLPEELIIVTNSDLSYGFRSAVSTRFGPQLQKKLKIYDLSFLKEKIQNYQDIQEKYFPENWHIYYNEISLALREHYLGCEINKLHPSILLMERMEALDEFVKENTWIEKLKKNQAGLDPIHIFGSFNGANHTKERRIKRINLILKALGRSQEIYNIDFSGCPAPVIINFLAARNIETQSEIWGLFNEAFLPENITQKQFYQYQKWRGIEFTSLTIFLFWCYSSKYLSMDKNTSEYLEANKIYLREDVYSSYFVLLSRLEEFNYDNDIAGERQIFRELVGIAYEVLVLKNSNATMSDNLSDFFQKYSSKTKRMDSSEKKEVLKKNKGKEINERILDNHQLGFRIIGLKINEGSEISGVLRDKLFMFDNCFVIGDREIIYSKDQDLNIYQLDKLEKSVLPIRISAVVGKNGSGKSTLTEILFSILNNVAFNFKEKLRKKDLIFRGGVSADLYWVANGSVFCLRIKETSIKISEYKFEGKKFLMNEDFRQLGWDDMKNLFYTIVVNYSLYSLNSNDLNDWIARLFHKNDGYQTPVVLNPMRDKGNIDINLENRLLRSRLMANLLQPEEDIDEWENSFRRLTKSLKAHSINLKLNLDKNKFLYSTEDENGNLKNEYFEVLKGTEKEVLEIVKLVFNVPNYIESEVTKEAEKYIIRKIISISQLGLQQDSIFDFENNKFASTNKIEYFLTSIRDSQTHIGYKLKQAINFLKYRLWPIESEFKIIISEASDNIDSLCSNLPIGSYDFNEFIPPSIFDPFIACKKDGEKLIELEKMSSGERHLIYSINSILYHIKNIASVHTTKSDKLKYRNIFILLDEIELYYHPDLQRKYLYYFLKMLSKLNISEKITGFSVLLVTHSPFILSDIPNDYLLMLDEGSVMPFDKEKRTFGANIYDLLSNEFFMRDGFIGEIAMRQIRSTIDYINDGVFEDNKHKEFFKLVNAIGDEAVRMKLNQLLKEKYSMTKLSSIEILEEQKRDIENRIEKLRKNGNS